MKSFAFGVVALICLLVLPGCRRSVSSDQSHDLDPNKLTAVDLPPAKSIVAEFITKDKVQVTAYLVRTEDATDALSKVNSGLMPGQAAKQVKYLTVVDGSSGTITPPKSEDRIAWTLLFTTKTATNVNVKTHAGN
jgi:hypothetical protein